MSGEVEENPTSTLQTSEMDAVDEFVLNVLGNVASQLPEHSNVLNQSVSEFEGLVAEAQGNFQELSDRLNATDISAEVESFQAAVSSEDRLTDALEQLQTAMSDWESEIVSVQTAWGEACGQTIDTLDALGEELNQLEDTFAQAQQDVQDTASGFEAVIAQLTAQVQSFQSTLNTSFEALTADLADTHQTALTEGFDGLIEQVGETQKTELSQHFTQHSEDLNQLYSTFGTEIDGLGDDLKDRCTQLIEDAGQYCTDEAQHELGTAMRDTIEDTITDFATEIAENLVLMGVGSSVTGSLSSVLPELVVAKKTAELVNAGLDAVDDLF
jgi:DNA repair exonuclease SbcCD ATPase subunit